LIIFRRRETTEAVSGKEAELVSDSDPAPDEEDIENQAEEEGKIKHVQYFLHIPLCIARIVIMLI
jgi:hypothetical protein